MLGRPVAGANALLRRSEVVLLDGRASARLTTFRAGSRTGATHSKQRAAKGPQNLWPVADETRVAVLLLRPDPGPMTMRPESLRRADRGRQRPGPVRPLTPRAVTLSSTWKLKRMRTHVCAARAPAVT